jgi:hypothetical protein
MYEGTALSARGCVLAEKINPIIGEQEPAPHACEITAARRSANLPSGARLPIPGIGCERMEQMRIAPSAAH